MLTHSNPVSVYITVYYTKCEHMEARMGWMDSRPIKVALQVSLLELLISVINHQD
jgi:hypothetical protein